MTITVPRRLRAAAILSLLLVMGMSACSRGADTARQVKIAPEPTATPTAAQRYTTELAAIQASYEEELRGIEELVRTSNPHSEFWRRLYRAAFQRLSDLAGRVDALEPPVCYTAPHEELTQASRNYRAAAFLITRNLDEGRTDDAFLRFVAVPRMDEGRTHLNEAARLARTAQC